MIINICMLTTTNWYKGDEKVMNDRKDKNRRIIYVKLCKEMRNVFCPINRDESTGWLMSAQCESLRLRKDGQEHREECSIYAL